LTEDRRKELVKLAKAQAEESRVAIRNIRRDGNESLKKLLKDSKITEDDETKGADELQKLTDSYIGQVNKVLEEKEKEIMEV
jgi:ribosome recycling factor